MTPSRAAVLKACWRGMRIAGAGSRDCFACGDGASGWGSCGDVGGAERLGGTMGKRPEAAQIKQAMRITAGRVRRGEGDIGLLSCTE